MFTRTALGKHPILGLAALLLFSGCTATAQPTPDNTALDNLFADNDDKKALAECLQELGWDAVYLEGGAVQVTVGDDEEAQYQADEASCWEEIGFGGPLTDEDFDAAYQWYSDISECLEDAGWPVPEKPTRETFESEIESNPWIPWAEIESDEIPRAIEICPAMNYGQNR